MTAFRTSDPGKSAHRVAAIRELLDYPLSDRPKSPEGVLELFLVHTEKGLPVILEESIKGAFRETPRLIGHVRLSGGCSFQALRYPRYQGNSRISALRGPTSMRPKPGYLRCKRSCTNGRRLILADAKCVDGITCFKGMNAWRAGCGESRTSGSEGGPENPICRETDRALRSDPYTYVPTWAGFLYLAVVIDVWSRRVAGWAMAGHLRTELVLQALNMAIRQRRPEGVIHHSDQGSQYTSIDFGSRCREFGVRPSMGSVGDAYDNALC